ncbi:NERD domain-containing protein [Cytobacillus spongiae]|uniref:nuclease-related domain-containing protein n=1 Tax=Cytobacillus spongiae TaxID=2901381 RepID=UPI001F3116B8|nr:nuclease-related domain-containing protein [Cytobacillus spongiae]UII55857.1 NERD domain-containing protein [Cytobacillus spongiae]
MRYKSREKTKELLIYESLNVRMKLEQKEKQNFIHLKKGFEGEMLFDSHLEVLEGDCLIFQDLLFQWNSSLFQVDTLLMTTNSIYLFEVKNYEGDFVYENDRLFKKPKIEVTNPLNQLNRSELLLRQLLKHLGCKVPIHAYIVFIHPEFTLYQTPLDKPFIFSNQLNRFLNTLSLNPSREGTEPLKKLADMLVERHIRNSPYSRTPAYQYDELQKGLICNKCHSFSISLNKTISVCHNCHYEEPLVDSVIRHIEEFQHLFPMKKITTKEVSEWCKIVPPKKIRNILKEHFTRFGVRQWTYFE